MQPYQLRVIEEKAELDEKIAKLTDFMNTLQFLSLPTKEASRMHRQHVFMSEYSRVLGERIAALRGDSGFIAGVPLESTVRGEAPGKD